MESGESASKSTVKKSTRYPCSATVASLILSALQKKVNIPDHVFWRVLSRKIKPANLEKTFF
jgi:hypothetical protein